jgi:hypothetical protein
VKIAEPLPECLVCQRPTRREAHTRNGGLCSRCRGSFAGLHVVDDDDDGTPTIVARGGYPPPLFEVDHGDSDD